MERVLHPTHKATSGVTKIEGHARKEGVAHKGGASSGAIWLCINAVYDCIGNPVQDGQRLPIFVPAAHISVKSEPHLYPHDHWSHSML